MTYNLSIVGNKLTIKKFEERLKDYKETEFYLRKLNNYNCLNSVNINNNGDYEYELENGSLILKNRIGSKSKYGIIYLTLNKFNKTTFATKLMRMDEDNYREIKIAKKLSKITIRNLSPHFLLVYKYFYCMEKNNKLPSLIKNENYYISVNELVNGNLKQYFDLNLNYSYIINALQQILIAILSFHYFTNGVYHHDCHYKNFLFIKIKAGGYFHYNIFNKNYYVKNMGYLWLIWDFGLAQDDPYYKNQRIKDYFRIVNFFDLTSRILSSNNSLNKILDITENILAYQNNFQNIFGSSDKKFFEDVFINQLNLFQTRSDIPKSFKKINKKAYYINDF